MLDSHSSYIGRKFFSFEYLVTSFGSKDFRKGLEGGFFLAVKLVEESAVSHIK
jgi:hypothetical protein